MNYLIVGPDGAIRRMGRAADLKSVRDEIPHYFKRCALVELGSTPLPVGATHWVDGQPEYRMQPDVRDYRRMAYPGIGDQLDVIWRQLAALPPALLLPETQQMLDRVTQIKQMYPKEG
ncbi:hypothetical protein N8I74_11115 [Chitiniphilus purpureus]|uniref:Uncharacterized protein n=1 Tax=Chitiniphilus purpureus TaxID=2981137 RepID=A0ABY6DHR9_9NEIS|nr:hypothetical protein [Chitiniphilus sp. CD1]UXY13872.1 hypothetical protein N8I74_11115 [Chitiniphilus sp. CD1]